MQQITSNDDFLDALDALVGAITGPQALAGDREAITIYWDRESGRAHWEA